MNTEVEHNAKWRSEFEENNTGKMLEIHNALKLLNNNISKVNTDSSDRYAII